MSPVEINCTVDTECPATLVCLERAAPQPNYCDCHPWYGNMGESCDEWGPSRFVVVLASLGGALYALIALAPAITLQVRVLMGEGLGILRNAPNSTLMLVSVGLALLAAQHVSYALEALLPLREGSTLAVYEDGRKRSSFKAYTLVLNIGFQTFAFLACLNVSVMWMEITERSRKMEMVTSHNVVRYRRVCFVVGVSFASAMLVCTLFHVSDLAALVAQPMTFPTAVLFRVDRQRLVNMLKVVAGSGGNAEMSLRARLTIEGVNACSWRVSTGLFLVLGFGLVLFLLYNQLDDRLICRPHQLCVYTVLSQCTLVALLYIDISILRYSTFMVRKQAFGVSLVSEKLGPRSASTRARLTVPGSG